MIFSKLSSLCLLDLRFHLPIEDSNLSKLLHHLKIFWMLLLLAQLRSMLQLLLQKLSDYLLPPLLILLIFICNLLMYTPMLKSINYLMDHGNNIMLFPMTTTKLNLQWTMLLQQISPSMTPCPNQKILFFRTLTLI